MVGGLARHCGYPAARLEALSPDVVLITDGGGKKQAALKPIRGAETVLRFLAGVRDKVGDAGAVEALVVRAYHAQRGRRVRERTYAQALRDAPSDLVLTTGFVHHVRERAATDEETALLDAALQAARTKETQA